MRDLRLFIAALGAILVSICSSDSLSVEEKAHDEPLRMASDSLVVKSYKNGETTSIPSKDNSQEKTEEYQEYKVYQGVMGRPGVDFPVFSGIPVTSFTCRDVKKSGYYADLETDCQVFHVCDRNRKISFLCPNGTIFRQSHLICDWWFRVDCGKSVEQYEESAEQLEADQHLYKVRAEEREIRRKKLKALNVNRKGDTGEASSAAEKFENQNSQSRKPERHSKKVVDFSRTPTTDVNFYENRNKNGNAFAAAQKSEGEISFDQRRQNISFSDSAKANEFGINQISGRPLQSFSSENNQENFYEAETGSLVEDLSNRNRNFASFKTPGGERGQTQYRQIDYPTITTMSHKRTSKKLNLSSRERNEYFSRNRESSQQKTQSFNEEKISSSSSVENGFRSSTYSGSTATYNANGPREHVQRTFNQHRSSSENFDRQNFAIRHENHHSSSGSTSAQTKDPIQGSRTVQSDLSGSRVTQQSSRGINGNVQTQFLLSTRATGQQSVINNGVGNSTKFEFSSTVSNEKPFFTDASPNINTENIKNENVNFGFTSTARPYSVTGNTGAGTKASTFSSRFKSTEKVTNAPLTTIQPSYQQSSNVPFSTIQPPYHDFTNNDGNIAFKNPQAANQQFAAISHKLITNNDFVTTRPPPTTPQIYNGADSNSNSIKENQNYQTLQANYNNYANQNFQSQRNIQANFGTTEARFYDNNNSYKTESQVLSKSYANEYRNPEVSQSNYNNKNQNLPIGQNYNKNVNSNLQISQTIYNSINNYNNSNQNLQAAKNHQNAYQPVEINQAGYNKNSQNSQINQNYNKNLNSNFESTQTIYSNNEGAYQNSNFAQSNFKKDFASTQTSQASYKSGNQESQFNQNYNKNTNSNFQTSQTNYYSSNENQNLQTAQNNYQKEFQNAQVSQSAFNSGSHGAQASQSTYNNNYNSNNNFAAGVNTQNKHQTLSGLNQNKASYIPSSTAFPTTIRQQFSQNTQNINFPSSTAQSIVSNSYQNGGFFQQKVNQNKINGNDNAVNSNNYTLSGGKEIKTETSNIYNNNNNKNRAKPNSGNQIITSAFSIGTARELYKDASTTPTYITHKDETKTPNFIVNNVFSTTAPAALNTSPFPTYPKHPTSYQEEEKQHLAETASFGSNPGGIYYSSYGNRHDIYYKPNRVDAVTEKNYEKSYEKSEPTESLLTTRPASNQFSTVTAHYQTVSNTPTKTYSEKVTFSPSLQTRPIANDPSPTTTVRPRYETATDTPAYVTDNIYYTVTQSTTAAAKENAHKIGLNFDFGNRTLASEVNLSLQELNINKDSIQTDVSDNTYEDLVRKGLEVPPSSGPNAIRSFALYYGIANQTADNYTEPPQQVTHHTPLSHTLSPFEIKKKEVLKQVDELVQKSSINVTEHNNAVNDKLPNSLTLHTQDSYLELFPPKSEETVVQHTTTLKTEEFNNHQREGFEIGTTDFGAFTEEPTVINSELSKKDLTLSQTRGLVEPEESDGTEVHEGPEVTPDLRRLAQVFTKALSAYLDDPEAFRRILSEIRPTEPTVDSEGNLFGSSDYPSATQEVDEVLDFSDVTKSTYKKKLPTTVTEREYATDPVTEIYNSSVSEFENLIFPLNRTSWATNIELTAPVLETLDESQSSYYTPLPFTGTTNQVAEEINGFITSDKSSYGVSSEEEIDSYLPITTTDSTPQKYGGFQNNNQKTTKKYSPYGAELSSSPYPPLGLSTEPTAAETKAITDNIASTTLTDEESTSFFSHFTQNRTKEDEIQLGKELNSLILLQKFTTPRGTSPKSTTVLPNLSTAHLTSPDNINQLLDVKLGNGEVLERELNVRNDENAFQSEKQVKLNYSRPAAIFEEPISASSTPKGFLITYSLENREFSTQQPALTGLDLKPTTYTPLRAATLNFVGETAPPVAPIENVHQSVQSYNEYSGIPVETTTPQFAKTVKSLERIVELQETLMFNDSHSTQHKDEARETVDQMVGNLNVTTSTTQALMKMMEMAAKNDTYKRLVLLLVNDKSAKNKTAEEARLSLLKALLTPVIQPRKPGLSIFSRSQLIHEDVHDRSENLRKSKSIGADSTVNPLTVTTTTTTTSVPTTITKNTSPYTRTTPTSSGTAGIAPSNARNTTGNVKVRKVMKIIVRDDANRKKSDLGNVEIIRKTIENSKNKQVKLNTVDEAAILNSDSRAVELLKSLYSLAARWG